MLNIFFKILILITFVSTLAVLGIKPKMHSKVLIYDSSYKIVENTPEAVSEIKQPPKEETYLFQKTVSNNPKQTVEKKVNKPKEIIKEKTYQQPKKETKEVKKQNTVKQDIKEVKPQNITVNKETKQTKALETQSVKKENAVREQKPEIKISAQTEEEIAWNKWRSALANQIISEIKLPYVPMDTVFKFSFDVDKFGRITNIQTWSLTSQYTPYAIQYIAPVIRSLQGREILDFPKGTQRTTTKFESGIKISDKVKFSTPNDFNDIEKVKNNVQM